MLRRFCYLTCYWLAKNMLWHKAQSIFFNLSPAGFEWIFVVIIALFNWDFLDPLAIKHNSSYYPKMMNILNGFYIHKFVLIFLSNQFLLKHLKNAKSILQYHWLRGHLLDKCIHRNYLRQLYLFILLRFQGIWKSHGFLGYVSLA